MPSRRPRAAGLSSRTQFDRSGPTERRRQWGFRDSRSCRWHASEAWPIFPQEKLSGTRERPLRWCEEHQRRQVFRDVEETVWFMSGDEQHRSRRHRAHLIAAAKLCPPGDDVVHLVLGVRRLAILLP